MVGHAAGMAGPRRLPRVSWPPDVASSRTSASWRLPGAVPASGGRLSPPSVDREHLARTTPRRTKPMQLALARDAALDLLDRAAAARPRWPRLRWLAAAFLLVAL